MIKRVAEDKLKDLANKFKAVAVTGARQTGKTTLVKKIFKNKPYLSLENPDSRRFALEAPRGFIQSYPNGAYWMRYNEYPNYFHTYRKPWIIRRQKDCSF